MEVLLEVERDSPGSVQQGRLPAVQTVAEVERNRVQVRVAEEADSTR